MSSSNSSEYLFGSPMKLGHMSVSGGSSNDSSADDWMTPNEKNPRTPSAYTNFHAFLLGISGTLTWNVYLSSTDFFEFIFSKSEHNPLIYFQLAYAAGWIFISFFLGPLSSLVSTKVRISLCNFILALLTAAFPVTCLFFKDTEKGFYVFVGIVFFSTIFSAVAQTSGFGFSVQISQFATGLNGTGMAIGGLLIVSLRFACILLIPGDLSKTTAIYYGLAVALLLYISISQVFVERTSYVKHLLTQFKEQTTRRTFPFMCGVFYRVFWSFCFMFLVNLVTYSVFPELVESSQSTNETNEDQFHLTWKTVLIVWLFNFGDATGRFSAVRKVNDFKKKWIFFGIFLRLAFVPLFIWFKYQKKSFFLTVLVYSIILILGLTNGITTNLLLIRTPLSPNLAPSMQEPAGFLNLFAIYLGILSGAFVSIPINGFDWKRDFKWL